MTNNSSNINESAKRYAKALMLSSEDNDSLISNFKNDYEKLLSLYEKNLSFRNFILTPLIKTQKKKDLLIKILNKINLCDEFISFFKIVANHGKLFLIEKIYSEFRKSLDDKQGITEVTVKTTEPLEKKIEEEIVKSMSLKLKKKIRLNKVIDPDIIGGVIIKIDSIMIDSSIKTKLLNYNLSERLG